MYAYHLTDPEPRDAHIYSHQTLHAFNRAAHNFAEAAAATQTSQAALPAACLQFIQDSRPAGAPGQGPGARNLTETGEPARKQVEPVPTGIVCSLQLLYWYF